jgi:hypothetical protein
MIDQLTCKEIEIIVDNTNKVWINLDGRCVVRIGEAKHITMDDPIRGTEHFGRDNKVIDYEV